MARFITYSFKGQPKRIAFSYDKHHDMFEAVAAAEGIDLTKFLAMEQQIAMTTRHKSALKDFRAQEFRRMGFNDIYLHKDEAEPAD